MTTTAVLILLLGGIMTFNRANGAAVLPTLQARRTPQYSMSHLNTNASQPSTPLVSTNASQPSMPVINTGAFNQCFKNDWYTREGSQCYAATYDFEICFKHNQTVLIAQDAATTYMCVCLPWPKDNRLMLSDMNFCFACLVAHGQPSSDIGGTLDVGAWDQFCASNSASTVTGDIIQGLLQEAPFLQALNQIESSATLPMTYDVPSGMMVGTLTTTVSSVTVTPTSIQLSGWETPAPGIWAPPDPFAANSSPAPTGLTVVNVTVTTVPETSATATTEFETPFIPTTASLAALTTSSLTTMASSAVTVNSPSSANATGSGGAPILGCLGGIEMLALIIVGLASVVLYV